MRRVVVTGLGCVTPLGNDVETTWSNMVNGVCGIDHIKSFDATDSKAKVAGEVKDFDPLKYMEKRDLRKTDLFVQYALAAAQQAVDDSGILGKSQENYTERVSDHICSEMHFVYCDLLGIPCAGIALLWNPDSYGFAGGDFRVCRHASSAGRYGNQRDTVYGDVCSGIWGADAALHAFEPWNILLWPDADQCSDDLCGAHDYRKAQRNITIRKNV